MFSSAALSVTFWEHYVSILQQTTVMILQLLVDSASFQFDPHSQRTVDFVARSREI